ncbi:MAG: Uma2 family endonuclease [Acidobacteriota bacterium]
MQQSRRHYSVEQYFLIEEMSDVKHEYYAGEIFAMAGGTLEHDAITASVTAFLHEALRASGCRVLTGNMRISTPSGLYTYPDVSVVCGKPDIRPMQGTDTVGNPVVLVEVLSPSTRDYDRGQKFDLYGSIGALRDVLLIEQSRIEVDHRTREPGGPWISTTQTTLTGNVHLAGVDLALPLARIYEGILPNVSA